MNEKKECCPNCETFEEAAGERFFRCGNADCLCHHPLAVKAAEETKTGDRFGS